MPLSSLDATTDSQRKVLEAFIAQNPDLTRLESLLARFNIFEATGSVRHELRHSDFLSYLLDPSRNHGLDTIFLKTLLQTVLLTTGAESKVSLFDLDFWNLSNAVVQREWHHVDILVTDEANRFAVIFENKIDTGEHSGQLDRYHRDVSSHYSGYKIVALYLTPEGSTPSSEIYHAVSYLVVCQVVEKIVADRRSVLGAEVVMALEHYAQMLRRHIVSESEVAELCTRIYQKHRLALDLIYEHKIDLQTEIGLVARRLVEANPELKYLSSGKNWLAYCSYAWEKSRRVGVPESLLFLTFDIQPQRLDFTVQTLGEGDTLKYERRRLYDMARRAQWPGKDSRVNKRVTTLYRFQVLRADDYDMPREELERRIVDKWREFLDQHLPNLMETIHKEEWLWETP